MFLGTSDILYTRSCRAVGGGGGGGGSYVHTLRLELRRSGLWLWLRVQDKGSKETTWRLSTLGWYWVTGNTFAERPRSLLTSLELQNETCSLLPCRCSLVPAVAHESCWMGNSGKGRCFVIVCQKIVSRSTPLLARAPVGLPMDHYSDLSPPSWNLACPYTELSTRPRERRFVWGSPDASCMPCVVRPLLVFIVIVLVLPFAPQWLCTNASSVPLWEKLSIKLLLLVFAKLCCNRIELHWSSSGMTAV